MSSPPLSRSSSPSLESVSDFSDDESASHVSPTDDAPAVNIVPNVDSSALEGGSTGNLQPENLITSDTVEPAHEDDKAAEAQPAEGRAPTMGAESKNKVETIQIPDWESPDARHERYFFTDDFLTFSVEGTIYRVHSAFFTRFSPYWAEMLARPGRSTRPTCMVGMRKSEMDAFLSTLYPTPDSEIKSRTLEDWMAILNLAHSWKFEEQRKLAIAALEPLVSPFEKLCAARKYDIEAWLYSAFVELCLRPTTLTLEEAKCLPLKDVMHIMSAREALYKGRTGSPSRGDVSAYVVKHIHAPVTPIPVAPGPSAPQTPAKPSANVNRPPPQPTALMLSATPTIKEKQAFAKLFSAYSYSTALRAVQSHNIQAFCDLLFEFSSIRGGGFGMFLMNVLIRGAEHRTFIPVGTELLKTIIFTFPPPPKPAAARDWSSLMNTDFTQDKARRDLRSHVDGMRTFWSAVDEGVAKYGDFTLAIARASSSGSSSMPPALLGLSSSRMGDNQDLYEERSTNLRTFFTALAEVDLVDK